ncbi:MAG: hypothetical protein OEU32_17135, partial [Acidimicrobiia bacterium]|nr:hypothetical protein [Acidimicrobiia bacterium]
MMRVVLIAVGVVVAVGLGVVVAMAVWPESSPGPTFVVDAEVVFSADEPLFARDLGCPDTDGVESPLETAVTRTNSTSVHPGELIGLRYTVDVLAPVTTSSLTLSPTWEADGMTVTSTPACVFRPASESASSGASLTSTGSSTGVPGAELTLTGLGPGDRDVIEVWIVIEEIDQGATFETSVGASGTGSDPVDTPRSLSSRFVPRPTATPEISLSGATDPVRAGETVSYRIRTENPSSTDLVLDVGLEIAVPDALTEVAVSVTDDAEAETPCDLADGGVVCAIGSLEPTEVVEIEVVATVTVSAPTGSGSTGPDCDQTVTVRGRLDPDVCVAATLILDGAATVTREYASDVLPLSLLVLESRPARPVFRNDEP